MAPSESRSPRDHTTADIPVPTETPSIHERRSTDFFALSYGTLEAELEELLDLLHHDSAFMDLTDREPFDNRICDIERELLARREERLIFDQATGRNLEPHLVPDWIPEMFPEELRFDLEKCR